MKTPQQHQLQPGTDPLTAIATVFDCMDVASLKHHLWELLKAAVTGSYHTLPPEEQRVLIEAYEQLVTLVDAAHQAHSRAQSITDG